MGKVTEFIVGNEKEHDFVRRLPCCARLYFSPELMTTDNLEK
jgi:hypothetical protein